MPASHTVRLAILECDTPVPPVLERVGTYGDVFKALLRTAATAIQDEATIAGKPAPSIDWQFSVFDVVAEPQTYPDLDDVDAVLITGSKHDSYRDVPWINTLVDYTAKILRQDRVKLVGICFGHQIIGRALGMRVKPNTKGWEVAVNEFDLTDAGTKLFGRADMRLQFVHRDIVHDPPAQVSPLNPTASIVRLGGNEICENQGMYSPGHFLSVQGHPEFTDFIVSRIVEARHASGVFTDEMAREFLDKATREHDGLLVSKAIVRFLVDL
ncbi:hypothetical protein KEM52_004324 [Ascosphaera acerosa]|nr:hypothetical protein KEM52_004324 [Ascosphaera acerosa]